MKIKPHYYITILLYIFSNLYLHAQNVITIEEKDRDGNHVTKNGENKETYKNNKIVDINSVLNISLDVDKLKGKIADNIEKGLPPDLAAELSALTNAMRLRNENIKAFNNLLKSYNYLSFKNDNTLNKKWASDMQVVAASINELTLINEDFVIGLERFRAEEIYKRAEVIIDSMQKKIEDFAKTKGIYVQFGAWIYADGRGTEINLPGFDSIEPKEPFEVERWQILPTDEQLQQLESIEQYARENKNKGLEILKELADVQIKKLKELLTITFNNHIEELKETLKDIDGGRIAEIKADVAAIENKITLFKNEIRKRVDYYSSLKTVENFTLSSLLSHINDDFKFIKDQKGKELFNELKMLYGKATSIIAERDQVILKIKNLKEYFESWFQTVIEVNYSSLEDLIKGEVIDFKALEFSDKVTKFSLKDLPTSTELDLFFTGTRKDGDRLAFKIEVNSSDEKLLYSEAREIYMFRVLPHIEGTLGVVFADPFTSTQIQSEFQLIPSYNMLIKGLIDKKIRRKSVVYNRLIDFGFGLHVSSPDFDGDDVPELGTGIVLSVLSDYLQSGAAINIFTGDPYWFFGIRIPFASFNIGGSAFERN